MENQNMIRLKLFVDKERNRVIFAECDADFVDSLFSFMTVPLGIIVSLARNLSPTLGLGCLNNLYSSVENLDYQYFHNNVCRNMLLSPHFAAESHCRSLKLKIDKVTDARYFVCNSFMCKEKKILYYMCKENKIYYYGDKNCTCGNYLSFWNGVSISSSSGFIKEIKRFIVSDDLGDVIPISIESTFSMFSKFGITDLSKVEERTLNIQVNEVINVVLFSLVSKSVLSDVFLKGKKLSDQLEKFDLLQGQNLESDRVGNRSNIESKTVVKLVISKSKNKVLFAEVKEDFVNIIFSFLTVPLGHVIKQLIGFSKNRCIARLYGSIQNLDDQCFKSSNHKQMLVNPKILPGFGYRIDLMELKETPHPSLNLGCNDLTFMDLCKGDKGGYLIKDFLFTVTDSMFVSPCSSSEVIFIFKELALDTSDIEWHTLYVGKEEVLQLLLASIFSESALTNVFIGKLSNKSEGEKFVKVKSERTGC